MSGFGFDYARSKAAADRLIGRFGANGFIRRTTKTGTAYNPTDGGVTNHACKVVIIDFTNREIDGTRVLATDKRAYVAVGTMTITPTPADELVDADGTVYKIIDPVRPLKPAGTTVMFDLQVRK